MNKGKEAAVPAPDCKPPIRADLQINDFPFSLIQGLAFTAFYATMSIPLGQMADSGNRRWMEATGAFRCAIPLASFAWQSCGVWQATIKLDVDLAWTTFGTGFPEHKDGYFHS